MPAGRFDGSRLRLAMISSLSAAGMRGLTLMGGTSLRSSPGLGMPCWANRPVNMRYIVAPRL